MFGLVLSAAFLLLLVTFRSIVIPIKAIVLNLLSVGAAYGVLTLVFQNGWAEGLLDFNSNGAIAPGCRCSCSWSCSASRWTTTCSSSPASRGVRPWHVDRRGRLARDQDHGGHRDQRRRRDGGVFSIFATLSLLDFKQMGVGLAVAVLIDATIIRASCSRPR